MAEDTRPPEPPKIKLGLGDAKSSDTPVKPVSLSGAPPKIKIQSAEKKSETARIELSAAQPPPLAAPPAPVKPGEIKEVSKDDLAEFYKKSTIRIDNQPSRSEDTQRLDAAKRSTMRVDAPPPAGDTQKVKTETHQISAEAAKKSTLRVDPKSPADTQTVKSETHRIQDVKKATMRVDAGVEQKKKSETAKLEIPASELTKRSTSKITLGAEAPGGESEDVFKKRTMPVSVPTTPPPSPAKPPTISVSRPKTMISQRPIGAPQPAEGAPMSPAPAAAVSEAKKSETARLDLPPDTGEDRPTTRPKTIRIKRPDGTSGRKALTIARPTDEAVFTPAAAAEIDVTSTDAEAPGAIWAVATLAAVLVTAVLIYVFAAQTFALGLPWPGKIL